MRLSNQFSGATNINQKQQQLRSMDIIPLSSNTTFKDQEQMVKDFRRYASNRVGAKINEDISVKQRVKNAMNDQQVKSHHTEREANQKSAAKAEIKSNDMIHTEKLVDKIENPKTIKREHTL